MIVISLAVYERVCRLANDAERAELQAHLLRGDLVISSTAVEPIVVISDPEPDRPT